MIAIDSGRIQAMVAQMRTAVAGIQVPASASSPASLLGVSKEVQPLNFSQIFKAQLQQVSASQLEAQKLGERFSLGDESVNLSDVMIATQKSSIALQATVQVRNKVVAAYHDIMNMQI